MLRLPMSSPRILVAYGTRPERIKLLPVQVALAAAGFEVVEWCSGQSKDLAGCERSWGATLAGGIADAIADFTYALEDNPPACVVVQGDTATAFACAQAAFLARVPVAHVEAGLRTYADEPWPEEAFRRQIAAVARWHFAPDDDAACNLFQEITGITSGLALDFEERSIHVTGNPVIDTLPQAPLRVLATIHRRENWGRRRTGALEILDDYARREALKLDVIHHPNWGQDGARSDWAMAPIPHDVLVEALAERTYDLVVTDSGGLQEECAHFGIPCAVLRTSTERVSLERTGAVTMVHPDDPSALRALLDASLARRRCYGDGTASAQIAAVLARELLG